jgi:hypothetical protein
LLFSCKPEEIPLIRHPVEERSPTITTASVSCKTTETGGATWEFQVETDAWTGNGEILLSKDGVYIEDHPLDSVSADADGAWDKLEATLTVVADQEDMNAGSATWFNCQEPRLSGILRVFEQTGELESDCRSFLEDFWGDWNSFYSCGTRLE